MKAPKPLLIGFLLALPAGCQPPDPGHEQQTARYYEYVQQRPSAAPSRIDSRALATTTFSNGGFENGDFSGWEVGDNGLEPLLPWTVCPPFQCGFFGNNEALEGVFDAVNGFDGSAGYEAFLFQDVEVPAQGGSIALADRVQFDGLGLPSSLPRVYELQLRDEDDNLLDLLHREEILLDGQPYTDLGWRQRSFDVSAHAGETVRLYVRIFVPEDFTGPAQLDIDDVRLIPGDGGGGGDIACELTLQPGPAATGAPFVLDMDFTNLGAAFGAKIAVLLIADGQVSTLHTDFDVTLSEGYQVTDFPVFSKLALTPLPPTAGLLVAVFDQASRGLACSNVAILGEGGGGGGGGGGEELDAGLPSVDASPPDVDAGIDTAATIRQLAEQYLAETAAADF